MSLRRATAEDADAIARVERAAAHHPWSAEAVRSTLEQPTTVAFVHDLAPVGAHLLASWVADEGEVLTLAVHPDHQRQGLARSLLAHCCAWWSDHGVAAAFLEVRADNAPALALYRSAGWTDAGTRRAYYRDGTDAVLLRWRPA